MKKIWFLLAVWSMILFSCVDNRKSIWDMARDSYNTQVRIDTIIPNVTFGMSKKDFNAVADRNKYDGKYHFHIEELYKYDFSIGDCYFNDSLYNIRFTSLSTSYSEYSDFRPISKVYELKYGKPDTIIQDKDRIKNYWFNGNLELSVSFSKSEYSNHLSIEYNDLSKSLFIYKDSVIRDFDDAGNLHCWTKDYYENIFLPKKREKLEGI